MQIDTARSQPSLPTKTPSANIKTPQKSVAVNQSDNKSVENGGVSRMLAREFSLSGKDFSQADLNASFLYYDIDISRLDLKRQQDIAGLIMDKDKLIEENSEKHRKILKDYEVLMDAFTLKDLELSRTSEAYTELLKQVDDYKANIKKHHEELVSKVRDTEAIVKDSINYSVGLVKYCTGVYSLWTSYNKSLIEGLDVDTNEILASYERELDVSYKPLEECYQRKPKRLIASLDDARSSHARIKSIISVAKLDDDFELISKMIRSSQSQPQDDPVRKPHTQDRPADDTVAKHRLENSSLAVECEAGRHRLDGLQRDIEEIVRQNEVMRSEIANQAMNISDAGKVLVQETESLCRKQQALALRRKGLEDERMKLFSASAKIKSKIEENDVVIKALEMDNNEIRAENGDMEESFRRGESRITDLKWQLKQAATELQQHKDKREVAIVTIIDLEDQLSEQTKLKKDIITSLDNDHRRVEELKIKISELKVSISHSEAELRQSTNKSSELQIEADFLLQKLDIYASKLAENQISIKDLESLIEEKNVMESVRSNAIQLRECPALHRDSEITFGTDSLNYFNMSKNGSPTSHMGDLIKLLESKSDKLIVVDGFRRELERYDIENAVMNDNIDELKRVNRDLVQEVAKKEARITSLRIEERELLQTKVKLETRGQLLDEEGGRLASFKKFNSQYNMIEMRELNKQGGSGNGVEMPLLEVVQYNSSETKTSRLTRFFDFQFWKIFIANMMAVLTIYFLYTFTIK